MCFSHLEEESGQPVGSWGTAGSFERLLPSDCHPSLDAAWRWLCVQDPHRSSGLCIHSSQQDGGREEHTLL